MREYAFKKIILSSFFKIKHRIPGRIRIYIPALEKLPKDWHSLAHFAQELIILKSGIKNAKIAPMSGTIVLNYSHDSMRERDVLDWLELIVMRFIDLRRSRKDLTKEECISMLQYLKKGIQLES